MLRVYTCTVYSRPNQSQNVIYNSKPKSESLYLFTQNIYEHSRLADITDFRKTLLIRN
jgi:hypothetical protein